MTPQCRSPYCVFGRLSPLPVLAAGLVNLPVKFGIIDVPEWVGLLLVVAIVIAYVLFHRHAAACGHCLQPWPPEGPTEQSRDNGRRLHKAERYVMGCVIGSLLMSVTLRILDTWSSVDLGWLAAAFSALGFLSVGVEMVLHTLHRYAWCPICHPDSKQDWTIPPLGEPTDIKQ